VKKELGWAVGVSILFLITGCGIREAIKEDTLYQKVLPYAQEKQLSVSFETKAIVNGVYLNPLYPGKFATPTFLVGVYNGCENNLTGCNFSIKLNGSSPTDINNTIPNYILYKTFPFYNNWANYYIVKFPAVKPPYRLIYSNPDWGKIEMKWKGKKEGEECPTPLSQQKK